MAQIIVEIPDNKAQHALQSLCERWGYDQYVADLPPGQEPPSKPQFVDKWLTQFVKSEIKTHDQLKAGRQAASGVQDPF